jgi:hypothetical protein
MTVARSSIRRERILIREAYGALRCERSTKSSSCGAGRSSVCMVLVKHFAAAGMEEGRKDSAQDEQDGVDSQAAWESTEEEVN